MKQAPTSAGIPLDSRQIAVKDLCNENANNLEKVAEKRFRDFTRLQCLEPEERTDLAHRAMEQVTDLQDQVALLAANISMVSTTEGTVDIHAGEQYLAQEVLREQFLDDTMGWIKRHRLHLSSAEGTVGKANMPTGNTEQIIWVETKNVLEGDLSNLSTEEEIMRSISILSEIRMQRERMRFAFYAAPMNSIKAVATTVASTVALLGMSAGLSLGLATTGAQYAHRGYGNIRQRRKFSRPECNAQKFLQAKSYTHRSLILHCMAKLEIYENVEELIGYGDAA